MRPRRSPFLLAAALAVVLASPAYGQRRAASTDTPADVMKAGQNGLAVVDNALVALTEARAVMAKMATDQNHARQILILAEKNDRASIISLVKQSAPRSTVQITQLEDFTISFTFTFGSSSVAGCASSTKSCGGGTTATLVIK